MKKLSILIGFILSIYSIVAQDFDFAKRIQTNAASSKAITLADASGNTYVIGSYSGLSYFNIPGSGGNFTSAGAYDVFITKYSSTGILNSIAYSGGADNAYAAAAQIDAAGNIYVVGSFYGTVSFGSFSLTSSGENDMFIAKFSTSTWSWIWVKKVGGTGGDSANDVDCTSDGSAIYVTGLFSGSSIILPDGNKLYNYTLSTYLDGVLMKFDGDGNYLLNKHFTGSLNDIPLSVVVKSSTDVYVSGYFNSSNFKPTESLNSYNTIGSNDIFLARFKNVLHSYSYPPIGFYYSFDLTSCQTLGSAGNDILSDMVARGSNITLVGDCYYGLNIGGITYSSPSYYDGFIVDFNSSMGLNWCKYISGKTSINDYAQSIATDASSNIYISGRTVSYTIDLDPGIETKNFTRTSGSSMVYMVKLNSLGEYIWGGARNNSSSYSYIQDITITPTGDQLMSGVFKETIDANMSPIAITDLTDAAANYDIYFAKYKCSTPVISVQPTLLKRCTGESASFSVTATGVDLQYQWYLNGIAISGATSSTYSIASVANSNYGSYYCKISTLCTSVQSNSVTLSSDPQVTTTDPSSIPVCQGAAKTISVTASGTAPITYQWYQNSSAIGGAITNTYSISSMASGNAGTYYCKVTNPSCSSGVNSSPVALSFNNNTISISSHPSDTSKDIGKTASFTVGISGLGSFTYVWKKNGVAISGAANSSSYSKSNLDYTDAGNYSCTVSSTCASPVTTDAATLTINEPFNYSDGWSKQIEINNTYIIDINFINKFDGIATSGIGILNTRDGGYTWNTTEVNYYPQSIHRLSSDYAWIAAKGIVFKWFPEGYWKEKPLPGGITEQLYDVFFLNENEGWAVGNSGIVARTSNGGEDWDILNYNSSFNVLLKSVVFINSNLGFACGQYGVYKTTDGGLNWVETYYNSTYSFNDITYTGSTLYAVGTKGSTVRSVNLGDKWTLKLLATSTNEKVRFINDSVGWVANWFNTFYTNDAGKNWYALPTPNASAKQGAMFFTDENNGWVGNGEGQIHRTPSSGCSKVRANLGATTQSVCANSFILRTDTIPVNYPTYFWTPDNYTGANLNVTSTGTYKVKITNICGRSDSSAQTTVTLKPKPTVYAGRDTGILVSQSFDMLAESNGDQFVWSPSDDLDNKNLLTPRYTPLAEGTFTKIITATNTTSTCSNTDTIKIDVFSYDNLPYGWFRQKAPSTSPTYNEFLDIYFVGDTGYAITSTKLYTSPDGGQSWVLFVGANIPTSPKKIQFIDANNGYILGSTSISKTTNGGTSWTSIALPAGSFNDMFFISTAAGWIVGEGGVIAKTTNSASTWVSTNLSNTEINIKAVHFETTSIGYACGSPDIFMKTADGGANWNIYDDKIISSNHILKDVFFVNSTTGWIIAENKVYKTINSGTNWTIQPLFHNFSLGSLWFIDSNIGFISTKDGIYRTNDGGSQWSYLSVSAGSDFQFNSVMFKDAHNGWVAGTQGRIYRTGFGGCFYKPELNIAPNTYVCSGDSITLNAETSIKNKNCTFAWYKNDVLTSLTSPSIRVPGVGGDKYKVNVTNLCNTVASDTFNISNYATMSVNAGNDASICSDSALQLSVNAASAVSYTWSPEDFRLNNINIQNPSFTTFGARDTGTFTYTVEVTSSDGCKMNDSVSVRVRPLPSTNIFLSEDNTCIEDSVTLSLIDYNSNTVYDWNMGDAAYREVGTSGNIKTFKMKWPSSGLKYIQLKADHDGCSVPDGIDSIFVKQTPVATFNIDSSACAEDDTIFATFTGGATGAAIFNWDFNGGIVLETSGFDKKLKYQTGGIKNVNLSIIDNGCSSTVFSKPINIISLPSSNIYFSQSEACSNDSIILSLPQFSQNTIYDWNMGDAAYAENSISGNTKSFKLKWSTPGLKSVSLSANNEGCYATDGNATITIKQSPFASFNIKSNACANKDILTAAFTGIASNNATLNWNTDGGTIVETIGVDKKIKYSSGGLKNIKLSINDIGCSSNEALMTVNVTYPYKTPICMVTVDIETGNNMVVWERKQDAGIQEYKVYRQSSVANVYNLLTTLPYSQLSVFVDTSSNHEQHSELYKITTVDTCGNELPLDSAQYHKTIFLQYVSTVGGVNLTWQKYEVENGELLFNSYVIYKGSDSSKLKVVNAVASQISNYTDNDPEAFVKKMYYRVAGVRPNECIPAGFLKANSGPFSHSISNLEDNRLRSTTNINNENRPQFAFIVNPNPIINSFKIDCYTTGKGNLKINILDITGRSIAILYNKNVTEGHQIIDIDKNNYNLRKGLYYVKVAYNGVVSVKKVVVQ